MHDKCGNLAEVQSIMNKSNDFLNQITDEDKIPEMTKINFTVRNFKTIPLGRLREDIRRDLCIEASYNPKAATQFKERQEEESKKSKKGNIRIYGYKHPKVMKFMSLILKCMKDCCEQRAEQLNLDMNNFLLLKNELSLAFLRNQDNILATLKSAIKIYGSSEENQKRDVEAQELAVIEKILKSHHD